MLLTLVDQLILHAQTGSPNTAIVIGQIKLIRDMQVQLLKEDTPYVS